MTTKNTIKGHAAALFSVIFWGTTFISTKILLEDFTPFEILMVRFTIGYLILWIMKPSKFKDVIIYKGHELLFAGAAITGVITYFLLENSALTYTSVSNVGVIVSTAPFFTALIAHFILKNERFRPSFFIGFLFAIAGIILISYNASTTLSLNPLGDIMALGAAFIWGIYSVLTKKISDLGYNMIIATRKIFFYSLLSMVLLAVFFQPAIQIQQLLEPVYLTNFLFLGIGASALCYVTWNWATKILGAVKTSIYIYIIPVIAIISSSLILNESMTGLSIVGTLLTIAGLFLSEKPIGKSHQ